MNRSTSKDALESYMTEKAVQLCMHRMPIELMDVAEVEFCANVGAENLNRGLMPYKCMLERDGFGFIWMIRAECDLYTYLESTALDSVGRMELMRKVDVAVSNALSYLHSQRIYHLDVRLTNIFLLPNGRIVLGDFGHAVWEEEGFCGHRYQHWSVESPDSLFGRRVWHGTDDWSLGCTLLEVGYGISLMDFTQYVPEAEWYSELESRLAQLPEDARITSLLKLSRFFY